MKIPKRIHREGRHKEICGKTRLLANGKSMGRIQMQPMKISRCMIALVSARHWQTLGTKNQALRCTGEVLLDRAQDTD
jgi:hypothetical protein